MKKKHYSIFWLLFCACIMIFAAGCSKKESPSEYYNIVTEKEQLTDMNGDVDTSDMQEYIHLGSQFYQGGRVQLWGEKKTEDAEGGSVYLHRENGDRELLVENIHDFFLSGKWWLDGEGRCYILKGHEIICPDMAGGLKPDAEFRNYEGAVFKNEMNPNEVLVDICQLEDGRVLMLIKEHSDLVLAELDPESGKRNDLQTISDTELRGCLIAPEGKGAVILGAGGVQNWDPESGNTDSLISFNGTSYVLQGNDPGKKVKEDFRMLEDGRMELLWSDGSVEYLSQEQLGGDKELVVLYAGIADSWLKDKIGKFNLKNDKYYIVLQENTSEDLQSFMEQTDLELATGKGPDIVCGDAVNDIYSLLEKGAFEDLASWMENSGIREEDYFPGAFSNWKYDGKIYGIGYRAAIKSIGMNSEVIGKESISGVEDLLDRLLAYEGNAIFQNRLSSGGIIRRLLSNSESLCGMVDFDRGVCDFSGKLFEKLLEAAKKYGYDEKKEVETIVAESFEYCNFYCFFDQNYLEDMGKITTGYLFDDGGYALMDGSNILAVNVNSDKKEGALEFVSFMLSDEVQTDFDVEKAEYNFNYFPTNKKAFEELCEKCDEKIPEGIIPVEVYGTDKIESIITGLTEERKAELKTALENARTKPLRTETIVQIIIDEAKNYFSDNKTIDEVREMVQNRVQLYLNEKN